MIKISIKKILDYVFAEKENFQLEHRIFLAAILVGILISTLGGLINFILVSSLISIIIPFLLSVSLIAIYYFVRFKKIVSPFITPIIIVAIFGISPDDLIKLFDISEVLSTKGTIGEKGTGLGLLLCKDFVEKHCGKIWVESEVGKDSDFKFTLPIFAE